MCYNTALEDPMNIVETQATPNPDSLKFILAERLVAQGARSFEDARAGQNDPVAKALFAAGPVASVFYMDRFVTVNKFPDTEWESLEPKIADALRSLPAPQLPAPAAPAPDALSDEELLSKINLVLDENIRPALAADGGGLDVLGLRDNVLSVHYMGACGGCPSASAGTLSAIQNLLRSLVDPRIEVVPQ
jgi:Fe-S cluster biogenesis protein NfuA